MKVFQPSHHQPLHHQPQHRQPQHHPSQHHPSQHRALLGRSLRAALWIVAGATWFSCCAAFLMLALADPI